MTMPTAAEHEVLMRLVEAYADARHEHGAPEYNAHTQAARNALYTALLHALTQTGGWVSVPRQADDAQVAAGMNALFNTPGGKSWETVVENIYADMVAARPLPPSPAAEREQEKGRHE